MSSSIQQPSERFNGPKGKGRQAQSREGKGRQGSVLYCTVLEGQESEPRIIKSTAYIVCVCVCVCVCECVCLCCGCLCMCVLVMCYIATCRSRLAQILASWPSIARACPRSGFAFATASFRRQRSGSRSALQHNMPSTRALGRRGVGTPWAGEDAREAA